MRKFSLLAFALLSPLLIFGGNDILAKLQMTVDPKGELAACETKITKGTIKMPEQKVKAEVTSYYKKPDKYRIDTILSDGKKEIRSYDGKKVLKWTSITQETVELKGLDRDSFILNAKLQNPDMREWEKEIFSSVNGDKEKVKCALKDGYGFKSPIILYIGKNNYIIRKIEMPASMGGKELMQIIEIKSYKKEGDALIAENMSSSIFGAVMDYHINDIKLNGSIEDSFFTNIDK
jgi:outer membrane lipoprotein-sorting protein